MKYVGGRFWILFCGFRGQTQSLNLLKVRHIHNSLFVSTGFVPWSRLEARKFCGVPPLGGIDGLVCRFVAPGFLTWRHNLLSFFLRKIQNLKRWRICYYCGNWNFALFASSIKMCQNSRCKITKTTKLAAEIWYGFNEELWPNRGLPSILLDTSIVIRGQKRWELKRNCECACLLKDLGAV